MFSRSFAAIRNAQSTGNRESSGGQQCHGIHGVAGRSHDFAEGAGALAALKSKPMIIASFDGDRYSWFVDSPYLHTDYLRSDATAEGAGTTRPSGEVTPVKALFTTFFFDEFIPRVEQAYRVNGEQRMVTGFSLGAWGAMHYMLARPEMFVSASTMPPPSRPVEETRNREQVTAASRKKYARLRSEIETELLQKLQADEEEQPKPSNPLTKMKHRSLPPCSKSVGQRFLHNYAVTSLVPSFTTLLSPTTR